MNIAWSILKIPFHKCKWAYFHGKVLKLPKFEFKDHILNDCKMESRSKQVFVCFFVFCFLAACGSSQARDWTWAAGLNLTLPYMPTPEKQMFLIQGLWGSIDWAMGTLWFPWKVIKFLCVFHIGTFGGEREKVSIALIWFLKGSLIQ